MHKFVMILLVFGLSACGDAGDPGSVAGGSSIERMLESNDNWPYETVGILDIVEAGYDDSGNVEWAVGSLITEEDEYGVSIEIDGSVILHAGINIDSGKQVRVLLESPNLDYGVKTYPVSKIESH